MEPVSQWSTIITGIVVLLFAISEFLGIFPKIKSNSVFQIIVKILKGIKDIIIPQKK